MGRFLPVTIHNNGRSGPIAPLVDAATFIQEGGGFIRRALSIYKPLHQGLSLPFLEAAAPQIPILLEMSPGREGNDDDQKYACDDVEIHVRVPREFRTE